MRIKIATALLIFVIFSLGGWVMIYLNIRSSMNAKKRMERECTFTTGRIVELNPRDIKTGRRGRTTFWYPVISFTANGVEYTVEGKDGFRKDEAAVNDKVDILYDPDDPQQFHLKSYEENEQRSGRIMMWAGIIWIAAAAVIAVLGSRMN